MIENFFRFSLVRSTQKAFGKNLQDILVHLRDQRLELDKVDLKTLRPIL